MPSAADFEKAGVFYLVAYDRRRRSRRTGSCLYDSKEYGHHAVCVGMTAAAKTGLCLALSEEAAIDGIPRSHRPRRGPGKCCSPHHAPPEYFRPWITRDDARRKNSPRGDYARRRTKPWRRGSRLGGGRRRTSACATRPDSRSTTPGSKRGIQLSILK